MCIIYTVYVVYVYILGVYYDCIQTACLCGSSNFWSVCVMVPQYIKWSRENTAIHEVADWPEQRDRVAKCRRSVTLHLYGGEGWYGPPCDIGCVWRQERLPGAAGSTQVGKGPQQHLQHWMRRNTVCDSDKYIWLSVQINFALKWERFPGKIRSLDEDHT